MLSTNAKNIAMEIRSYQTQDTSEIIELWQSCGLTVPWNNPGKDISRKLKVQPELFLVGVLEAKIVASAMAGYDGHRGWIYYLAVDPDCRNKGFGRMLVEAVAARLKSMGCPKLNIMVRSTNEAVIEFYQTIGFQKDDVVCLGSRLAED